jgi:hypothetical protein
VPGKESQAPFRICVCVILQQPFVGLLPLLRDIYRDRFSNLVFLVPFEETEDEDVVTVYRGPYARMGYLTDAYARLAEIDCDHFLVIGHDVLLNPCFDERTLLDKVPLGRDEGFFPSLAPLPDGIGGWSRYFGIVPKLAFPKSILFGSGIERDVLRHYLPDHDQSVHKLANSGPPFRTAVTLGTRAFGDVVAAPSRVLLHGESEPLAEGSERQAAVDAYCLDAERALVTGMATAIRAEQGLPPETVGEAEARLTLAMPVTRSTVPANLYILPKSQLKRFAHHAGVAAAANLDADLVVPTLLYILCSRVWSASDCALSLRGVTRDPDPALLAHSRILAVEPFEAGWVRSAADRRAFVAALDDLHRPRRRRAMATIGVHKLGLGGTLQGFAHDGWHRRESWGRWSSQIRSTLRFWVPADLDVTMVRIGVAIPVHPRLGRMRGQLSLNGGAPQRIDAAFPDPAETILTFPAEQLRRGAMNNLHVESERMVQPAALNPAIDDRRRLGLGVSFIEFARQISDLTAPAPFPPVSARQDDRALPAGLAMWGWHGAEPWGRWSQLPDAMVRFTVAPDVTVEGLRVRLRAPISPANGRTFSGWVRLNDGEPIPIVKRATDPDAEELYFAPEQLDLNGVNLLHFHNDMLVRAIDDDPACGDERPFGFGLLGIDLLAPDLDPLRLPSATRAAGGERFFAFMQDQRAGGPATPLATPGEHLAGLAAPIIFPVSGWYPREDWGRWASSAHATIQFWVAAMSHANHVHLGLRAAPQVGDAMVTGRVRLNGMEWMPIQSKPGSGNVVDVFLDARNAVVGGMNWIEIVSDRMTGPTDFDPTSHDPRRMGFGVATIGFG